MDDFLFWLPKHGYTCVGYVAVTQGSNSVLTANIRFGSMDSNLCSRSLRPSRSEWSTPGSCRTLRIWSSSCATAVGEGRQEKDPLVTAVSSIITWWQVPWENGSLHHRLGRTPTSPPLPHSRALAHFRPLVHTPWLASKTHLSSSPLRNVLLSSRAQQLPFFWPLLPRVTRVAMAIKKQPPPPPLPFTIGLQRGEPRHGCKSWLMRKRAGKPCFSQSELRQSTQNVAKKMSFLNFFLRNIPTKRVSLTRGGKSPKTLLDNYFSTLLYV